MHLSPINPATKAEKNQKENAKANRVSSGAKEKATSQAGKKPDLFT
jgi:hypothetical protein